MQGKIAFEEHFALEETFFGTERFSIPGMADDLRTRLLDFHDHRLRDMDEFGIELAIQSLNSPGVQQALPAKQAIELAVRANDVLAAAIAKRPDRFAGFAALPMQDPDAAIAELERCIGALGFKGAMLNGFTEDGTPDAMIYYDLPQFRPFWARVADLDVPIYLHPRNPLASQARCYEGHPWLTNSTWAFAVETSIHALRLMGSGLFDEHPNLQIVLGHLGERIPYDLWRVDHRIRKSPQGIPAKKSMTEYFKENFHLTVSGHFYEPSFKFALAEMGVERVLFSVDYPFETTADAAVWFDRLDLSDDDRLRIGRTNAIRLFKLDL